MSVVLSIRLSDAAFAWLQQRAAEQGTTPEALAATILEREPPKSTADRHDQPVDAARSPIPVVPLAENPLFDDWLAAVEDYRTRRDAEERAADGEAD